MRRVGVKGIIVFLIIVFCSSFSYAATVGIVADYGGEVKQGLFSSFTPDSNPSQIGKEAVFGDYVRQVIDFNTSSVPVGSTINSVTIQLTKFSETYAAVHEIRGLPFHTTPTTTAAEINPECTGGVIYNSSENVLDAAANNVPVNISLNNNAISNVSTNLGTGIFSVCIRSNNEGVLVNGDIVNIYNYNEATPSYRPVLWVDYTPPVSDILNITLVSPVVDSNVTYNDFFNFTVNVSCNGSCGDVNVSLDPIQFLEKKSFYEKYWDFALKFFREMIDFSITGMATGNLVSTTLGDQPFYTNSSNPKNYSHVSCLENMTDSSCLVTWWVNATNSSGTYEFFAFANSSIMDVESEHINLTIINPDIISPTVSLLSPVNETFTNVSIPIVYNVSDNNPIENVTCVTYIDVNDTGYLVYNSTTANDTVSVDYITLNTAERIKWYVNCTDLSGNYDFTEERVFYYDQEVPESYVVYPNSTTDHLTSNLNLNITIRDNQTGISSLKNSTVTILDSSASVKYQTAPVFSGVGENIFSDSIDVSTWSVGEYNLSIVTFDLAGNVKSNIVKFNVSYVAPAPSSPPSGGGGRDDCEDGIDNDGDGLIDYPDDPGCESRNDNDEYNDNSSLEDIDSDNDDECEPYWVCEEWGDCQTTGLRYRECFDQRGCSATMRKSELSKCDYSKPDNNCKYEWNCSDWTDCSSEGWQYRDCTDMGEIDPSNYCMSTAWEPESKRRCSPVIEQAINYCGFPYVLFIVFVLSYIMLLGTIYRVDRFYVPRENIESLVNFSKLKAILLLVSFVFAAILILNPCIVNDLLKSMIVVLILFAFFLVYVFFEKYDYSDKGEDEEVDSLFLRAEKLEDKYMSCKYCHMKFKDEDEYYQHVFYCKYTYRINKTIRNLKKRVKGLVSKFYKRYKKK